MPLDVLARLFGSLELSTNEAGLFQSLTLKIRWVS